MCEIIAVQSKCMCNNAQPRQEFWYNYNARGIVSKVYCKLASNAVAYENKPWCKFEIPWFQSWHFLYWKYWTRWASSLMKSYDHTGLLYYWSTIPETKKNILNPQSIYHLPTIWLFPLGYDISSLLWLVLAWLKLFHVFILPFVIQWEMRFRSTNGYEPTCWPHEPCYQGSPSVWLYEDFDTNIGYVWDDFFSIALWDVV